MTINERAANWWAERWMMNKNRDAFRAAVLEVLPDGDWHTYNDYDPQGILLDAVRKVVPECRGWSFSSVGLLPDKHGLQRDGDKLYAKYGYGTGWVEVE